MCVFVQCSADLQVPASLHLQLCYRSYGFVRVDWILPLELREKLKCATVVTLRGNHATDYDASQRGKAVKQRRRCISGELTQWDARNIKKLLRKVLHCVVAIRCKVVKMCICMCVRVCVCLCLY